MDQQKMGRARQKIESAAVKLRTAAGRLESMANAIKASPESAEAVWGFYANWIDGAKIDEHLAPLLNEGPNS